MEKQFGNAWLGFWKAISKFSVPLWCFPFPPAPMHPCLISLFPLQSQRDENCTSAVRTQGAVPSPNVIVVIVLRA